MIKVLKNIYYVFLNQGLKSGNEFFTILKKSIESREPKLECWADKMREIVAMVCWLTPLYFVCVL